jgi:acyl-CoA reductase-like NAD-dependent aldehyde dehydrogenase
MRHRNANKSAFGNGAAIFTNSGKRARIQNPREAGMVGSTSVCRHDGHVSLHGMG